MKRRTRALSVVALACGLILGGCDRNSEPTATVEDPPAESPQPSIEHTSDAAPIKADECEDSLAAIDEETQVGAFEGDFDGDGADDKVRLHHLEDAEPDCRAILVVESEGPSYTIPVWRLGADGGLAFPTLYAMAEINGLPGLEILVNEAQGASSQFIGAYTVVDGRLRMIAEPGGGQFGGLFAYGGSVGHLEAVDCVGPSRIVVTVASPAPGRKAQSEGIYEFDRRFYIVEGAELVPDGTESLRAPFDIGEIPEFGIGPFASCS